jgi:hypothetical protein
MRTKEKVLAFGGSGPNIDERRVEDSAVSPAAASQIRFAPVSADIGSKTLGWGHLITLVLEKKRFDVPKVELVGALSLN